MRRAILALMLLLVAAPAAAQEAAVSSLVADYEAWWRADDPISAGFLGDRAALSRMPDVSPGADARRLATLKTFKARLDAISPAGLPPSVAVERDVLRWTLDNSIASIGFDEARIPLNDDSFVDMMSYVASATPVRTPSDAEAYIARLEATPGFFRQNVENMRRGIRTRFTQPRATAEKVMAAAREAARSPVDGDALLAPLQKLPDSIPASERAALLARGRVAVQAIKAADTQVADFIQREYLPAARPRLGARTLPNGEAYYRYLVRLHTTTDMTPDQIHELGLSEVARIRAQMQVTMRQAGWTGDLATFIAMLRKDPRFYAKTPQELLEKASEIAKRIDDKLPGYFATLPRLTYGVRPVPDDVAPGYTTARYWQGSPQQGVAGGYMVNTYALDQRPLYELPALTAHEAVPGHHLQIALAQELPGVPDFMRSNGFTAFVEGWGLYGEKLAGEMGIYRDPYERFGQLSYEMWRACRLVADTGIHWKGWSVDQARACFTENTALAPHNIETELSRYVAWPGQALGYKVGELTFLRLREKARTQLGAKFDIRRFHDAVLAQGPVPMSVLEQQVDRWIAAERGR